MLKKGRSWHIMIDNDSSLARNMMPNADMIVEIIKP
jgi:hypothetical protein